jgi:hypothetical protein
VIGGFIGNPIGGVVNVSSFALSITTGVYAIAGQAALFADRMAASAGSYAITGQSAAFIDKIAAVAGSYAITGQAAAFADKLTAVAGSYAITGQAALFATRMPVTAGAYAITGQGAAFNPKEAVTAGSYALTGSAITFKIKMPCATGAYAITGGAVTLTHVINGAGGESHRYIVPRDQRKPLRLARRKIIVTDDEGRTRRVDLLRHLKPPPPFAPAPDWVLPQVPDLPLAIDAPLPMAMPPAQNAPRLPESLLSLQHARDDNDLINFLMGTPDPLVEDIRQVLGVLAASGQLEALENA